LAVSFVRPEVRAALWRWREVLAGAAITALGANWAFASRGLLVWLGWPVLIVGLAFLVAGLQRARVRPRSGGPGMIELDEGQLTYLHPDNGAIVALPAVVRIEIETTGDGPFSDDLFWRFFQTGGYAARIPASAVGAERLFDALASFPGADYQKVIEASGSTEEHVFVIWQKDAARLH
jgi:hypothetical protein